MNYLIEGCISETFISDKNDIQKDNGDKVIGFWCKKLTNLQEHPTEQVGGQ